MELNTNATTSAEEYPNTTSENKFVAACNNNEQFSVIRIPEDGEKSSKHSSKKQSKRRKKSSNHTRPLPRIIVKPLPPPPPPESREWTAAMSYSESCNTKPSTMREVLASIPGFSLKPRKRSGKKLSTAAQLQQTREGCIDLETPDSILVNTNIRQLLNKHTFSLLPPLYQYKLGQLLPSVERLSPSGRLNPSSLNNEFFSRACLEWQNCLSGGEFTPENQQKMKTEAEKEKSKIDPWKLKHFEPIWGEKSRTDKSSLSLNTERPSLKTTIKLRPTASITSSSIVPKSKKSKSSSNSKRMRSVGAVTRSSSKVDDITVETTVSVKSSAPVPDLLPLKHAKHQGQTYEECQVDCNFSDTSSIQRMDESVTSTPIDPLLLPDGETESSEMKQELDISIVTIEEFNAAKECNKEEAIDSDTNLNEAYKRMSDDSEGCKYAKRIKFEQEEDIDNGSYIGHTTEDANSYSQVDGNNDQVCQNKVYSENVDTNSQDEKVEECVYNYDERTELTSTRLEAESHVTEPSTVIQTPHENIITLQPDPIDDVKSSPIHGSRKEYILQYQDNVDTELEKTDDIDNDVENKTVIQTFEVKESEDSQPVHNFQDVNSAVKCEEKERLPQNVTQNYYDERFKDAESFILETGLSSILTTGIPIILKSNL